MDPIDVHRRYFTINCSTEQKLVTTVRDNAGVTIASTKISVLDRYGKNANWIADCVKIKANGI